MKSLHASKTLKVHNMEFSYHCKVFVQVGDSLVRSFVQRVVIFALPSSGGGGAAGAAGAATADTAAVGDGASATLTNVVVMVAVKGVARFFAREPLGKTRRFEVA